MILKCVLGKLEKRFQKSYLSDFTYSCGLLAVIHKFLNETLTEHLTFYRGVVRYKKYFLPPTGPFPTYRTKFMLQPSQRLRASCRALWAHA